MSVLVTIANINGERLNYPHKPYDDCNMGENSVPVQEYGQAYRTITHNCS